jgi:phosphatidylinositol kinase/protein kinase (PI-3  family)
LQASDLERRFFPLIFSYFRQELLAVQLLGQMKRVFDAARLPLWLYPHGILVVGKHSALIETIANVKSIHQHKKAGGGGGNNNNNSAPTLSQMFGQWFGEPASLAYETAQKNFVESLAGYSVASYLLQIKDRHNGNLLLDNCGHICHIDFGFMLGQSPGGISFESAPFKLVAEWVELMGGAESDLFHYFKALLVKGFAELIKHREKIIVLVEMMGLGKSFAKKQPVSCLQSGPAAVEGLRARFETLGKTEEQILKSVVTMVATSLNATSTGLFDRFQFATNAILY